MTVRSVRALVVLGLVAALCGACGGKAPAISLRVESRVSPIDRLTVRAYATTGAFTDETTFPATGTPTLPGVISVETGAHVGTLRFFVWGWNRGERTAFGMATVTATAGVPTQATATLEAIGPDTDADTVPDAADNCPAVANGDQADSDGAPPGDVCRFDGGTPDAGVACPGNLFSNGDFETGAAGWFTDSQGNPKPALTLVPSERPDGGNAARICHLGTGSNWISFYSPTALPPLPGGKRYLVSSQVRRSPVAADGGSFSLGVLVRATNDAGTKLNETTASVSLATSDVAWHALNGASMQPGAGVVAAYDVYFAIDVPPAGVCFDVDNVCVTREP